jgi:predicted lipoprotein with Yx(FWY)xxD motif
MINSLLTKTPHLVKPGGSLAVTLLAAGLLATACGSSSSGPQAGGTPSSSSTGSTMITAHSGSAGQFLTDGSGRAVYLWMKDSTGKSACSSACAGSWPPVTANGTVTSSGGVTASELSTITRSDGSKQVAYDGHALYYYSGDSGQGQNSGQGNDDFGAKWYLVAPSGTAITGAANPSTPSAPASSSPASSSSAGGGWG